MTIKDWPIQDVARHTSSNKAHFKVDDTVSIDTTTTPATLKVERKGIATPLLHVQVEAAEVNRRFARGRGVNNNNKWNRYRGITQQGPGENADMLIGIIGYKADDLGDDDDTEVFIATRPPVPNYDEDA